MMDHDSPRHHCLIYEGAPSRHLTSLAAVVFNKLSQNYRCLYLNSRPMVAGMRSYLAAAGVDVTQEIKKTSLILSSEQNHLVNGHFQIDRMMDTLAEALEQALKDGYEGLWASGDMTWEMGPDKDFSKLVEYECHLEEFFREHPEMGGICQYHADSIPPEVIRHGYLAHRSLFINETLSLVNPHYVRRQTLRDTIPIPVVEAAILRLCHADAAD
jgi:hypothetical protein